MNRDDIIRLAQEAGGRIEHIGTNIAWFEFLPKNLERFAALVAAAERETCASKWQGMRVEAYRDGYRDGQVAEREACAVVCENRHRVKAGLVFAAAIRKRGEG